MRKIIAITSWAQNALKRQEFSSVIDGFALDTAKVRLSVVNGDTEKYDTAFMVEQILRTEERYGTPMETLLFVDVQPSDFDDNLRPRFVVARLATGQFVCGPHYGNEYHMIRHLVEETWMYGSEADQVNTKMYRDGYARVVAHLADYMEDQLDLEEIHQSELAPSGQIGVRIVQSLPSAVYTISLKKSEIHGAHRDGHQLVLSINKEIYSFMYHDTVLPLVPRAWHIYHSSSGDPSDPYMEIVVDMHTAEKLRVGNSIFLK